eukprot:COSAG02_NODE_30525_length_549_cov_1.057778_1_plen_66_part_00
MAGEQHAERHGDPNSNTCQCTIITIDLLECSAGTTGSRQNHSEALSLQSSRGENGIVLFVVADCA